MESGIRPNHISIDNILREKKSSQNLSTSQFIPIQIKAFQLMQSTEIKRNTSSQAIVSETQNFKEC